MAECSVEPAAAAEHSGVVLRRRLNTRYHNEEANWMTSCRACFERAWSDYDSMWADSGQGHPFRSEAPPDERVT